MRESTVEKAICDFAKKVGISTLKLAGSGARGKADRLFMRNGKSAFMEIKAPGSRPTALQLRFLEERRLDGFPAEWFSDVGAATKWLREQFDL
jgi:hypothetical protein